MFQHVVMEIKLSEINRLSKNISDDILMGWGAWMGKFMA